MAYQVGMPYKPFEEKFVARKLIQVLLYSLPVVLNVTLFLSWWQYPEEYSFFTEYISALYNSQSANGLDNYVSMVITIVGYSCMALILMTMGIIYLVKKNYLQHAVQKSAFAFFLAFSMALAAVPHDVQGIIHNIGAFLSSFCFAVMNVILLIHRYFRKQKFGLHKNKVEAGFDLAVAIFIYIVMVQFLLFYFFQFIAGLEYLHLPQITQKINFIANSLAIFLINIEEL